MGLVKRRVYLFIINTIQAIHYVLLECVAGINRPAPHATLEPLRPLRGAAMSERVGTDLPSGHALKSVVSHRRGGSERALHVPGLEQISLLR